jgi:hypothetical protein
MNNCMRCCDSAFVLNLWYKTWLWQCCAHNCGVLKPMSHSSHSIFFIHFLSGKGNCICDCFPRFHRVASSTVFLLSDSRWVVHYSSFRWVLDRLSENDNTSCVLLGPALDQASVKAADHVLVSVEEQMRQKEHTEKKIVLFQPYFKCDKWRLIDYVRLLNELQFSSSISSVCSDILEWTA